MQTTSNDKSLFAAEKKLTFFLLCLATFLLLYVKKVFIESETAAFVFLEDRPEGGVLQLLTTIQFLSIPLIYLWKFTVIGFVIWVGSFLFGYKITYSQCWGLVIVCEFTFLLPELIKIFWFMFIETDPRLSDVNAYYPLSLMNFFDYYEMDKRYVYPLKALNVFEIIYWFLLVEGVHHFARKKRQIAWIIVSCSYILIFFLWLWFYIVVYK